MNDQTAQKAILNALSQHQAYSYRVSTQAVNEILKQFYGTSNKMVSELRDLLESLTEAELVALASGKYTTSNLKEVQALLNTWFQEISIDLPETFAKSATAMAVYEASYVSTLATGTALSASGEKLFKLAKSKPLAGGMLVDEMFKNISISIRQQVEHAIRDGINHGQTNQEIVTRIKGKRTKVGNEYQYVGGVWDVAKSSIERTVRTARSHVANVTYDDTWKALGFTHVKFVSTLDGRTSKQCASLDQLMWEIDSPLIRQPPLHYNCRSTLIGVDKDGKVFGLRPFVLSKEKVKDIPKDQRDGIIGQVSADTSFKDMIKNNDGFAREWLGPSRYKLYKQGDYSIDKFVDPQGGMYSLAQLEILVKKTSKALVL